MGTAPRFGQLEIEFGQASWPADANGNFAAVRQHLDGQPHQHKRLQRISASNTSLGGVLNLTDYPAANYEGHYGYLVDPESGQKRHIYSDGTNWKYVLTDANVTGIS